MVCGVRISFREGIFQNGTVYELDERAKVSEPERIPIADPRVRGRYRSVDIEYSTIHRAADGTWYKIRNKGSVEADNRLHSERERNTALTLKKLLEEEDRGRAEKSGTTNE